MSTPLENGSARDDGTPDMTSQQLSSSNVVATASASNLLASVNPSTPRDPTTAPPPPLTSSSSLHPSSNSLQTGKKNSFPFSEGNDSSYLSSSSSVPYSVVQKNSTMIAEDAGTSTAKREHPPSQCEDQQQYTTVLPQNDSSSSVSEEGAPSPTVVDPKMESQEDEFHPPPNEDERIRNSIPSPLLVAPAILTIPSAENTIEDVDVESEAPSPPSLDAVVQHKVDVLEETDGKEEKESEGDIAACPTLPKASLVSRVRDPAGALLSFRSEVVPSPEGPPPPSSALPFSASVPQAHSKSESLHRRKLHAHRKHRQRQLENKTKRSGSVERMACAKTNGNKASTPASKEDEKKKANAMAAVTSLVSSLGTLPYVSLQINDVKPLPQLLGRLPLPAPPKYHHWVLPANAQTPAVDALHGNEHSPATLPWSRKANDHIEGSTTPQHATHPKQPFPSPSQKRPSHASISTKESRTSSSTSSSHSSSSSSSSSSSRSRRRRRRRSSRSSRSSIVHRKRRKGPWRHQGNAGHHILPSSYPGSSYSSSDTSSSFSSSSRSSYSSCSSDLCRSNMLPPGSFMQSFAKRCVHQVEDVAPPSSTLSAVLLPQPFFSYPSHFSFPRPSYGVHDTTVEEEKKSPSPPRVITPSSLHPTNDYGRSHRRRSITPSTTMTSGGSSTTSTSSARNTAGHSRCPRKKTQMMGSAVGKPPRSPLAHASASMYSPFKENVLFDGLPERSSIPKSSLEDRNMLSFHSPFSSFSSSVPFLPLSTPVAAVNRLLDGDCRGPTLKVTIHGMSPLPPSKAISNPFVRVWVVDGETGRNLLRPSSTCPTVSRSHRHSSSRERPKRRRESSSRRASVPTTTSADSSGWSRTSSSSTPLFPAHACCCGVTAPFDMRMRASRSPWWEADIRLPLLFSLIHERRSGIDGGERGVHLGGNKKGHKKGKMEDLEDKETEKYHRRSQEQALREAMTRAVLLVEVCEAGNESLAGGYLPRYGVERICWGYLMLFGDGTSGGSGAEVLQLPASNVQLQLFPDYTHGLHTNFPTPWYQRAMQRYWPSFWSPSYAVFALAKSSFSFWRSRKGTSTSQREIEEPKEAFRTRHPDGREGYRIGWPGSTTPVDTTRNTGASRTVVFGYHNDTMDDAKDTPHGYGEHTHDDAATPALFFLFRTPEARKVNFRGGLMISVGYEEERWEGQTTVAHWHTTSTEMIKKTTTFSYSENKHGRKKMSKVLFQSMWHFSSPFSSTPHFSSPPSSLLVYEAYLLQQLLAAGIGRFSPFPSLPPLHRMMNDEKKHMEEGKEAEWRRQQRAQREVEERLDQSLPTLLRQQRWRTFQRRTGDRALLPNQWLGTFMVEGSVSRLAISPNGRFVAVAVSHFLRYDIHVYDPLLPPAPTSFSLSSPLLTLHGHSGHIHMLRFSPTDDRVLVSGGADMTVRVWMLEKHSWKREATPARYRPPSPRTMPTAPFLPRGLGESPSEGRPGRFTPSHDPFGKKDGDGAPPFLIDGHLVSSDTESPTAPPYPPSRESFLPCSLGEEMSNPVAWNGGDRRQDAVYPPFSSSPSDPMPRMPYHHHHHQEEEEEAAAASRAEKGSYFSSRCVYVLPHSFAVYDAVFHEGHLLTCGCSPSMWTWKIPLPSPLSAHEMEDSLSGTHATANASTSHRAAHASPSRAHEGNEKAGDTAAHGSDMGSAGSPDRSSPAAAHHSHPHPEGKRNGVPQRFRRPYDSDSSNSSRRSSSGTSEQAWFPSSSSTSSPYSRLPGGGGSRPVSRSSPQKPHRPGPKGEDGGDPTAWSFASHGEAGSFDLVSRISNEENAVLWSLGNSAGRLHHQHHVWSVSSSGKVTCWRAVEETYDVPWRAGEEEEKTRPPRQGGSRAASMSSKSVASDWSTTSYPDIRSTLPHGPSKASGGEGIAVAHDLGGRRTSTPQARRGRGRRSSSGATAVPGEVSTATPSSRVKTPPPPLFSRKTKEKRSVWEISVRRHVLCEGAIHVSVAGKYVLVTCVEDPLRGTIPEPSTRRYGNGWHLEESNSSMDGGSMAARSAFPPSSSGGPFSASSGMTMLLLDDATGQMLWKVGSPRFLSTVASSFPSDGMRGTSWGNGVTPSLWWSSSSSSSAAAGGDSPLSARHGTLLPGGDAFAIGTAEGRLMAWESVDGGLATSAKGFDGLQLPHAIERMAWALHRHLVAFASPLFLTTVASSPPFSFEEGEEETWRGKRSREYTAISIAGRCTRSLPSSLREVLSGYFLPPDRRILSSSTTAVEQFTVSCGGVLTERRRQAIALAQNKEQARRRSIGKNRKRRLYEGKRNPKAKVPPLVDLVGFSFSEGEYGDEEDEEGESQEQSSDSENDEKKKEKKGKKGKKKIDPLANELATIQSSMFKQQQRLYFEEMNHLVEFWKDLSGLHRHHPQVDDQ